MRTSHRLLLVLCLGGALAGASALAQVPAASPYAELANLREDVRLLNQRVGELTLRLEQLEREAATLKRKADQGGPSYATVAQLNEALSEMHRAIKAALASSKDDTLKHVAVQMEKLANQTNAAIDSLAKAQGARTAPVAATSAAAQAASSGASSTSSDSYPKEGIPYVVQKGDTIARIAQKTGAKQQDIIAANRLSDPSKIQVGQTLFIPGGK